MTDGTSVFWTWASNGALTSSGIHLMPAAGGDIVTVVSGQNGITSMAVDDSNVYFNEYSQNIKGAPKGVSGSATVLARLAGGVASTNTMAVDDSEITSPTSAYTTGVRKARREAVEGLPTRNCEAAVGPRRHQGVYPDGYHLRRHALVMNPGTRNQKRPSLLV